MSAPHPPALPPALAPWAKHLALFSAPIALALGPMLLRIHALVGGGDRAAGERGEPDGYDGIARRGPFDQLIHSEWALLTEVPEEFLRRAASGELSFARRAFAREAGAKRCVLLFDAGPEQLGAPRIAQLAVLLVMAARAEREGASLAWGVLQDDACVLHSSVSEAGVMALLNARSWLRVAGEDAARWAAVLGDGDAGERWVVGARELEGAALVLRSHALCIEDAREPGEAHRVRVAVHGRDVLLDVPGHADAVKLLTDPFGVQARATNEALLRGARAWTPKPKKRHVKLDVRSNLLFSSDVCRLFALAENGDLVVYKVKGHGSDSGPELFSMTMPTPAGHRVVAVGESLAPRRTHVLIRNADDESLSILVVTKAGRLLTKEAVFVAEERGRERPHHARLARLLPPHHGHCQASYVGSDGARYELVFRTAALGDRAFTDMCLPANAQNASCSVLGAYRGVGFRDETMVLFRNDHASAETDIELRNRGMIYGSPSYPRHDSDWLLGRMRGARVDLAATDRDTRTRVEVLSLDGTRTPWCQVPSPIVAGAVATWWYQRGVPRSPVAVIALLCDDGSLHLGWKHV